MTTSQGRELQQEDLFVVPSSTLAFSVLPFITSADLLVCRLASRRFHSLLHESDEAEEIWRRCLVRDFGFGDGSNFYLKTLRTAKKSATSQAMMGSFDSPRAVSIFGCTASEGVFVAPSAFDSWKHWRRASERYFAVPGGLPREKVIREKVLPTKRWNKKPRVRNLHGPYFLRAAAIWSKIEKWCMSQESGRAGTSILSRLLPGICFFDWKYRRSMQVRYRRSDMGMEEGLFAIQAVYAFYGGQDIKFNPFSGLLGGYFNDHFNCARLLSVNDSENIGEGVQDMIPIAASSNQFKVFCLHITSGNIYLRFRQGEQYKLMLAVLEREESGENRKKLADFNRFGLDSALIWLEEYASRLFNGYYRQGRIVPGERMTDGISLFPSASAASCKIGPIPTSSFVVTRGVEVVSSAIYVPEFLSEGTAHIFAVRIRLLTKDEEGYLDQEVRGFETCQLESARWEVNDEEMSSNGEHSSTTSIVIPGDGIVRTLLLLKEGGYATRTPVSINDYQPGTFCYQHCVGPVNGSICGSLQFIPGSLLKPTGESFSVKVPPFAVSMNPKFLF